jgi:hypothetical protein
VMEFCSSVTQTGLTARILSSSSSFRFLLVI